MVQVDVAEAETIDITVRDRKQHLIGWSMRISFDVTRLHFPCIVLSVF